jgi:hypothetical protein
MIISERAVLDRNVVVRTPDGNDSVGKESRRETLLVPCKCRLLENHILHESLKIPMLLQTASQRRIIDQDRSS